MLYRKKPKAVCFVACGSGGHLFPMISCAQEFGKRMNKCFLITDRRGLQQLKNNGEASFALFDKVFCEEAHYKFNFLMFFNGIRSLFRIWRFYSTNSIECVFGFGSYLGLLGTFVARIKGLKTFVYESNAVFGFANKISAFFSNSVFFNFLDTKLPFYLSTKAIHTGHPLRESISKLASNEYEKLNHHKDLYRIHDKINILVLGGSQGSSFVSEVVSTGLCLLDNDIKERINIFHQARQEDLQKLKNRYLLNDFNSYEVSNFFSDISKIMTKTHICLSRAGASTISELISLGVPTILIPLYKSANNHQLKNAKLAAKIANFLCLEQQDLTRERIANVVGSLIEEDDLICQMHYQAKKNAIFDAHLKICDYVEFYLSK